MPASLLERSRTWMARTATLLPCACALCGMSQQNVICQPCRARYIVDSKHRCAQCATPLVDHAAHTCGKCLHDMPAFDATITVTDYAAPMDQLVLALKFHGRTALAPAIAVTMRDTLLKQRARLGKLPDILIPVPLSEQRLRERGFNQALEIAKPLAHALGIPLAARLAVRIRDTRAQSQLPLQERHANLQNAFSINPQHLEALQDKHIGLIDDVMTTGDTLNELASTLKRFGAARVTNIVFARTPPLA